MLLASLAALWASLLALLPVLQDEPASPLGKLALAVLTPLIAWGSAKLYDGLKTILPFYDKLPAPIHQALAPIFGFLIGFVAGHLHLTVVPDIGSIDQSWINGLVNALVMAGIFRAEKAKTKSDATVAVETSRASQPIR